VPLARGRRSPKGRRSLFSDVPIAPEHEARPGHRCDTEADAGGVGDRRDDVLRTAGSKATATRFDVFNHELQAIQLDPLWREVRDAALNLAPVCQQCVYKSACGGGHIASRWSKANRYNNPSVYCDDIKDIFGHIWERIANDISHDDTVDRVVGLLQS
jgi:radical SAM protein with 4Fe4S-binding SPASM domain